MSVKGTLRRLIEYSLHEPEKFASQAFPMFSSEQIRAVYRIAPEKRCEILKGDSFEASLKHAIQPSKTHRNPEQERKMREQSTDPSNL